MENLKASMEGFALQYEQRFSPLPCRKLCYLHLALKEFLKLPVRKRLRQRTFINPSQVQEKRKKLFSGPLSHIISFLVKERKRTRKGQIGIGKIVKRLSLIARLAALSSWNGYFLPSTALTRQGSSRLPDCRHSSFNWVRLPYTLTYI